MRYHRIVPALAAICFTVTLLWCGDANCLAGSNEADCVSLVCSLLGTHDTESDTAAHDTDGECSCVCHLPSIPADNSLQFPLSEHGAAPGTRVDSPPLSMRGQVYHPPIAS